MFTTHFIPRPLRGAYAERSPDERVLRRIPLAPLATKAIARLQLHKVNSIIRHVLEHEETFYGLSMDKLRCEIAATRSALRSEGMTRAVVGRCIALHREAFTRLESRHPPISHALATLELLRGRAVEVDDPSARRFAVLAASSIAALAGVPVHVISTTDDDAKRNANDAEELCSITGVRIGTIRSGLCATERRAAYAQDITFVAADEVALDSLRDQQLLGGSPSRLRLNLENVASSRPRERFLLLRGLHCAIIDGIDDVLLSANARPVQLHAPVASSSERPDSSANRQPLAVSSYPAFFTRYLQIAGVGSSLSQRVDELTASYNLSVVSVAGCKARVANVTERQGQRRIFRRDGDYWQALVDRVGSLCRAGNRPIVAMATVESLDELAARLATTHVPFQTLPMSRESQGTPSRKESELTSRCSSKTAAAILTTDTALSQVEVARLSQIGSGGSHLITTYCGGAATARRFFHRLPRTEQPIVHEEYLSCESELALAKLPWWCRLLERSPRLQRQLWVGRVLLWSAQKRSERLARAMRRRTARQSDLLQEQVKQTLAFSGTYTKPQTRPDPSIAKR